MLVFHESIQNLTLVHRHEDELLRRLARRSLCAVMESCYVRYMRAIADFEQLRLRKLLQTIVVVVEFRIKRRNPSGFRYGSVRVPSGFVSPREVSLTCRSLL